MRLILCLIALINVIIGDAIISKRNPLEGIVAKILYVILYVLLVVVSYIC